MPSLGCAAERASSSSGVPHDLYTQAQVETMIAGAVKSVAQVFVTELRELRQAHGQSPDKTDSPPAIGATSVKPTLITHRRR